MTMPVPPDRRYGRIVRHYGVEVRLAFDDGDFLTVRVKRNSGHVVGDRVCWHGDRLERLERRTLLQRQDPFGKVRSLAANLDGLGIVLAPQPVTPVAFIERVLVAARSAAIAPFLLVNKADLADSAVLVQQLRQQFGDAQPLLLVSALSGAGLTPLRDLLAMLGCCALAGQSGVGKSALLNALCPGLDLQVGELAEGGQGGHTSSVSTLVDLASGGSLIDTPGFRDFAPVQIASAELPGWFPGFAELLHQGSCRFRDCRHRQEPGCVIRQALADGRLSAERYGRYLALLDELEAAEQRQRGW